MGGRVGESNRSSRTHTETFEDLFAEQPAVVKSIGERLREIIRDVLPNAEERIYVGWKIALYLQPAEVCGIQPVQKHYCNLYFSNGAQMKDPDGLLEGTGENIRHVKVRDAENVPVDKLKKLIEEAKRVTR